MSLTVTEANAVNRLIDYLTSIHDLDDQVTEAIEVLVTGANKKLGAGARPDQVPEITRRITLRLQAADSDGVAQVVCRSLARHVSSIPWPTIRRPFEEWQTIAHGDRA